jgi:aminoglycoside 3-N-acetyltransferase
MTTTIQDLRTALRSLGLAGRALCAHASLRSFGCLEGGAMAIVDAFVAEGCTLVVPTFTYQFGIAPPADMRPPRNGWDYTKGHPEPNASSEIFSESGNDLSRVDMGALPAAVLATPGRARGRHPLNSFSAVGPLAREIIETQQPLDVYGPLRALAARRAPVVLMGVGLNRMTLIHLAEQMAGRTLFRRWAKGVDGRAIMTETGGCSEGFGALEPVLAPTMRRATVGTSEWQIFDISMSLSLLVDAIRSDPTITSCSDPSCERCQDSIAGGPIL